MSRGQRVATSVLSYTAPGVADIHVYVLSPNGTLNSWGERTSKGPVLSVFPKLSSVPGTEETLSICQSKGVKARKKGQKTGGAGSLSKVVIGK